MVLVPVLVAVLLLVAELLVDDELDDVTSADPDDCELPWSEPFDGVDAGIVVWAVLLDELEPLPRSALGELAVHADVASRARTASTTARRTVSAQ